jgi:hypothetical protein
MLKRLPPLKLRLVLLMSINPLLAPKAALTPTELVDACSQLMQQGQDAFQQVIHAMQLRSSNLAAVVR